jgi:hypothetical protein
LIRVAFKLVELYCFISLVNSFSSI